MQLAATAGKSLKSFKFWKISNQLANWQIALLSQECKYEIKIQNLKVRIKIEGQCQLTPELLICSNIVLFFFSRWPARTTFDRRWKTFKKTWGNTELCVSQFSRPTYLQFLVPSLWKSLDFVLKCLHEGKVYVAFGETKMRTVLKTFVDILIVIF